MAGEQAPAVVPQYVKIAGDLREKIKDGFYGPGALLPSRNEISAMYGVSAITARDALSVLSHEGYAKAIRGRGHIVRRKRSRLTVPARMYAPGASAPPGPAVPLELHRVDVYQEPPPDNIALPLETGADRKSTRLNSSHPSISYAVFCLKKKTQPDRGPIHRGAKKASHP